MRLKTCKFAVAGGVVGALCYGWTTVGALIGIPGFMTYAKLLAEGYGLYGYSISWLGVFVGAFFGFIEGFLWLGLLALIYNKLVDKK